MQANVTASMGRGKEHQGGKTAQAFSAPVPSSCLVPPPPSPALPPSLQESLTLHACRSATLTLHSLTPPLSLQGSLMWH